MLKFTVKTEWWANGEGPFVGDVEIARPTKALLRLAAAAHADGAIVVTEGLEEGHVQSQEDAEKAYREAQGEIGEDGNWTGPWADGNRLAHSVAHAEEDQA